MTSPNRLLDPVCGMIVDLAEARDHGLTMELGEREYGFCGHGCLVKFAKTPQQYIPKVDAWLEAEAHGGDAAAPIHTDALLTIDQGVREWYKSCRCCLSDAHPEVVEQLDAEKTAMGQPPSAAGICETAEAMNPGTS